MNTSAKTAQIAAATVNDPRWLAVVARDREADGLFYYSVKTTGVYCRPSCAARLARPENVRFHAACEDAEKAGFRPCKRCKPNQPRLAEQYAAKVTEACRIIEESETAPGLEELAKRVGVSAYHFHRVFKQVTGLTPREYADDRGCAGAEGLLTPEECDALARLYPVDGIFRSRVVMARHGFGSGEYKYFSYPLPDIVSALRTAIYPHLAPIANRWNTAMGIDLRYPAKLSDFIARCHAAGQLRPTPLMLRYEAGDYNCLHQDLYGEHVFPLQVTILLSEPGRDFTGGEFVLTEQRPRMQSRAEVVPFRQGDAVVFAVRHRPVQGARGVYRVNLRHGVSRLRSGHRYTVGIIFHDAT